MATQSSILAWKIPWTEQPGGLSSMGSQRLGHDLATKQQQIFSAVLHNCTLDLTIFLLMLVECLAASLKWLL